MESAKEAKKTTVYKIVVRSVRVGKLPGGVERGKELQRTARQTKKLYASLVAMDGSTPENRKDE